jgi:hypothetical protein
VGEEGRGGRKGKGERMEVVAKRKGTRKEKRKREREIGRGDK